MRKLTPKRFYHRLDKTFLSSEYVITVTIKEDSKLRRHNTIRLHKNSKGYSFAPITLEFIDGVPTNLWSGNKRLFGKVEDIVMDKDSILISLDEGTEVLVNLESETVDIRGGVNELSENI